MAFNSTYGSIFNSQQRASEFWVALELTMTHKYKELTESFSSLSRNQKTGHLSADSWVNWLKLQNQDFSRDSAPGPGLQILMGEASSPFTEH